MANIKIAQLTDKTTIADTDIVIIEDASSTKKMTVSKLKELLKIDKGGIVDSGSNANGNWVKYADGTMKCYGIITKNMDISKVWGVLFYSDIAIWTFPQPFVTGNRHVTASTSNSQNHAWAVVPKSNLTKAEIYLVRPDAISEVAHVITVEAVGRWK